MALLPASSHEWEEGDGFRYDAHVRIPLAGPGLRFVFLGLVLALLGLLGLYSCALGWLAAPGLLFAAFSAYFFRDPERETPQGTRRIFSPGDGTVLSVGKEGPGDLVTVRIFLAVTNVHVQRAPLAAKVEKIHYQPGGFAMAMKQGARQNERTAVTFTDGDFRVIVEQIAGFVARRIECWVGEGRMLAAGERYGMIRFGSQCAVHFPESCKILVGPGDRVIGGITAIGERP